MMHWSTIIRQRVVGVVVSSDGRWEQKGKRLPWLCVTRSHLKGEGIMATALVVGALCFMVSDAIPAITRESWRDHQTERKDT